MERCDICKSIICEITLFNGETKHFCSVECVRTKELIETFRDYIQMKINKYQYIHKDSLVDFLHPEISKKIIRNLISEVLNRDYFQKDKEGFIYSKDKIINIPRK